MKYYLEMFKRTFDFRGRSGLKQYWQCVLVNMLFAILSCVLALPLIADISLFFLVAGSIMSLYYVVVALPMISLTVRRLRDAGYSPWFLLLTLLLGIGTIAIIIFLCSPSKNNYLFNDYQNNTDEFYQQTYGSQNPSNQNSSFAGEARAFGDDSKIKDDFDFQNDGANDQSSQNFGQTQSNEQNIKNDSIDSPKADEQSNTIIPKAEQISISNSKPKTRSELVAELQEQLKNGEISAQEYEAKMFDILKRY